MNKKLLEKVKQLISTKDNLSTLDEGYFPDEVNSKKKHIDFTIQTQMESFGYIMSSLENLNLSSIDKFHTELEDFVDSLDDAIEKEEKPKFKTNLTKLQKHYDSILFSMATIKNRLQALAKNSKLNDAWKDFQKKVGTIKKT